MNRIGWNCPQFSLAETLECGQCFRYEKLEEKTYRIIAEEKIVVVQQKGEVLYFDSSTDIPFWKSYFHSDRDYTQIKSTLSKNDPLMAEAISFASGIRLLRQDFFETLLSFIISQNNHIPRIKKLIQTLATHYGRSTENGFFFFPTPQELSLVTEADYRALGFGFRGRYLEDAVKNVLTQDFSKETLSTLPTIDLRKKLMSICGVGQKVADCVMLFSLERYEVFPTDVWIKRIYSYLYANNEALSQKELDARASDSFGDLAGFAQQYLFYYGKEKKLGKD